MKKFFLLLGVLFITIFVKSLAASTYVNPLSRLAEYNLGDVNQFASEKDINGWPVAGKIYQWGRNVPFPSTEVTLTAVARLTNLNNAEVWGSNFITSAASWYSEGSVTDVWSDSVVATVKYGAPDSYVGNNLGDPSPVGYHVPSKAEFQAIVHTILMGGAGLTSVTEADIDIDGSGTLVSYSADYNSPSSGLAYALRFKGTVHATAFKYEWVANRGLQITAKQATTGLTITDISDSGFDWSGAIIRQLPLSRYIGTATAATYTAVSATTVLYYTGSGISNKDRAASVSINSTYPRQFTHLRACALPIRPIKDFADTSTNISTPNDIFNNIELKVRNGGVAINVLKPMTIIIYDIYGRLILNKESAKEELFVTLPKGVYIVCGKKIIV